MSIAKEGSSFPKDGHKAISELQIRGGIEDNLEIYFKLFHFKLFTPKFKNSILSQSPKRPYCMISGINSCNILL